MRETSSGAHPAGRRATRPRQFGWRDWYQIVRHVAAGVGEDHLSVISAGVAFWAMFALFPAIAALIAVYGLVADPGDVATRLEQIRPLLPSDAYGLISTQVDAVVAVGSGGLRLATILGLLISLWTVRGAVAALMDGLNVAYGERERRSIVHLFALSVALAALLVLVAAVAIGAIVVVPTVLRFADLGFVAGWLTAILPWAILAAAVVFAIGVLYGYGPSRARARRRWISLGALVAAVLWLAASLGFSLYVASFADYNRTYGSLGAIMVLLLWFYVGAFSILLGAELNAQMELHTERDTTTGRERPMGKRGAYVADHVR